MPTSPCGSFLLISTPAPSVLSPLALSEQMHLLFSWAFSPASKRPAPRAPHLPRLSSPLLPPLRDALTLPSLVPACGRGVEGGLVVSPALTTQRPTLSAQSDVRRDRGKGESDSGTGGRKSPSEPQRPRGKGESESEARTLPELELTSAVTSYALERRPSHCSFSPQSCAQGPPRPRAEPPAERYQRNQEKRERGGFPGKYGG